MKLKNIFVIVFLFFSIVLKAQTISGYITSGNDTIIGAVVKVENVSIATQTDLHGFYKLNLKSEGSYTIKITAHGYDKFEKSIKVTSSNQQINFEIVSKILETNEVVVTGTMEEVSKSNSPVPVEIYNAKYFKGNPSPNLFDALQVINGVQPQLNCNVCNTGDIHINGMDGPYTMVLIDGMPIVSSLSTVYGLMGIPMNLVERIEVVKGPASTLYGSEAVAGLINIITKSPKTAPKLSLNGWTSSYQEYNFEGAKTFKVGKHFSLLSTNYFRYLNPKDDNKDNFTDMTLQHRISLFNKWQFTRAKNRKADIAIRYFYEDRWGGEMNWNSQFRGTDSVYGESIYTKRYEVIGQYDLPFNKERVTAQFSYNYHNQHSAYGNTWYLAQQHVGFAQILWHKNIGVRHKTLTGLSTRYTIYDDNTPATQGANKTPLPGLFIQDEIAITDKNTLLLGIRADYHNKHGLIYAPRANWKFSPRKNDIFRLSVGNGFRVVNVFTEDHAALTGSRSVEMVGELAPEKSWNANLNYNKFTNVSFGFITYDLSVFYTYFTNKIIPDYDTDPNKIIYSNINGYAVSKGVSLSIDCNTDFGLKANVGATLMDVYKVENKIKDRQVHSPPFMGTFNITYPYRKFTFSYTGNVYGPMLLPVLPNDYRPSYSPWFSIQNIQVSYQKNTKAIEWFVAVKNLLNFTPKDPIMRPFDPFDKRITENNPNNYSFDPTYTYASMQKIRLVVGVKWNLL